MSFFIQVTQLSKLNLLSLLKFLHALMNQLLSRTPKRWVFTKFTRRYKGHVCLTWQDVSINTPMDIFLFVTFCDDDLTSNEVSSIVFLLISFSRRRSPTWRLTASSYCTPIACQASWSRDNVSVRKLNGLLKSLKRRCRIFSPVWSQGSQSQGNKLDFWCQIVIPASIQTFFTHTVHFAGQKNC